MITEFSNIIVSSDGRLLTEEDCWEFLAENMAPFTSSSIGSNPREPRENLMQKENAEQLVEDFFSLPGRSISKCPHLSSLHKSALTLTRFHISFLQALQIVSADVYTACHLGVCIAVRTTEVILLVNSEENSRAGEERMFTNMQVESALRMSGLGKRSKQRFLRINCRDSVNKPSKKGAGGNTTPYNCFIVKLCTSCWDC